jgi:hypothetical protein
MLIQARTQSRCTIRQLLMSVRDFIQDWHKNKASTQVTCMTQDNEYMAPDPVTGSLATQSVMKSSFGNAVID